MDAPQATILPCAEQSVEAGHYEDAGRRSSTRPQMEIDEVAGMSPPRDKVRIVAIVLALYLAVFIAALDQTIIATAIPTIATNLHSSSGYAWIGSAYLLATAAFGPVWAKFSDIWGRKPALLAAVILFAGSSILAALSDNIRTMVVARALQGVAGGGLLGLAGIVISDLFSVRERTLYFGLMEIVWALAGGIGPLIGGALTQYASWRWCFWINLPSCGITLVLLLIFLDTHNPRTKFRDGVLAFDWLGTVSIIGVTLMLLLGLDFGGITFPWNSPAVILLIIFGVVMIGVFWITEKRVAKYPLMPLRIFRTLSTNAVLVVCFVHGICFIAAEYYIPLYLQSVRGASPLRSGILILPLVLSEATSALLVGIVMSKTGRYREIVWVGLVFLTIGNGLFLLFSPEISIVSLVFIEIVAGIGAGCLFEPPIIAVQAVVNQENTATATSTVNFIRNMGTAISLVLGAVVFQNGMNNRTGSLRDVGLNSTLIDAFSDGRAAANVALIQSIEVPQQRRAVEDAFSGSLHEMWIMYLSIAAVGLFACSFVAHRHLSTEHTEFKTGLKKTEKT